MTDINKTAKPFGLSVSIKVALEAIHENIAPTSVIIGNLFYLQKNPIFPKNLDKFFFSVSKYQANDNEKKAITVLLESLKKPQVNASTLLENLLTSGWVKKIPPKSEFISKARPKPKLKPTVSKKEIVQPIVTIKKNRNV